MEKEDIQLWLKYIALITNLMRNTMCDIVKDKNLSAMDFNRLNWYLDHIDHTTKHIKELAEQ